MKHLSLILIILILSCCPLHPAYAFFDKDIRLLTMRDGLADNTIPCIYKDEDGFMWFGTDNGLSRYDGKTIQNFKPANTYVSIAAIVRLSDDFLGIVSDGYLYYFNRKRETFLPIHTESDTAIGVFNVLPADDSSFWGISGNRLILCQWEIQQGKEEEKTAVRVRIQKTFQLLEEKGEVFSSLCYHEKAGSGIWLTTNRGNLILFHPDTPEAYQKIPLTDGKTLQVTSILNRDGVVWVSTIGKGIVRYHTKSGHMDRISYGGTGKENLLSHTDVYQTIFIGNNRYLAVTWGGYTLLMPDEKQPEELTSEIYNNTHTQIYRNLETRMISACYDPNGLLWIGTNGGGVMYSDLRSQFYDRYYQDRHNEICDILMDDSHRLWLATYHKGIMRSDIPYAKGKKLSFSKVDTGSGKSEETMLCALKDVDGNLWFGNINGTLTVYHVRTGRFVIHSLLVDGVANRASVWALYMDDKNRLYVGTEDGLLLYNRQTGICVKLSAAHYLNEKRQPFIRAIAQTKDGTIWLGTSNMGVCRVVESASGGISVENGYEQKMNMEYRSVRSLLASSDGNLYIGYTDGFAILSPRQNTISARYTTNDGLCSNFIGCIAEDSEGHIWLGSNSGISRYGRRQHLFYNYYIAGSNRSALFSDKTLFFGNNQSLTYFNPEDINAYPTNGRVLITGLEVDNHPVGTGEKINNQIILNQFIPFTDRIVLDNDNKLLGVITSQSIVELVDDEMGEDYAMFAGLTAEEDLKEPLRESLKKRLPWLLVLLGLGMVVSSVVGVFETVVSQLTIIMCFQSLILDMAGNVGTQSLAVTIRVLMDESLTGKQKAELVWKEMTIGFSNGLILGTLSFLVIGLYIALFKGKTFMFAYAVSGCIGIALVVAMVISGAIGTCIPLFFKKINVDPAVASGPLITTINDLVAVVTYYGLSWIFLIEMLHLAG